MVAIDGAVRPRKRRRWLTGLVIVVSIAILAGAGAAAYAWTVLHTWDSGTEKIAAAFPAEAARPPAPERSADGGQAQNILLLGSDTRGEVRGSLSDLRGQRSDSIMVVHVPADRQHLFVMSIMRDSWVEIPGHGSAKVNAALSLGGVPLVVQTVEGLLGARIDHVAVVDFNGFTGITDALGGVDIDNPIGFPSSQLKGHYFPEGMQRMDGKQALAFVRERYAFADGDFQRARNQQLFLKAVMAKTLTRETLTNPARINELVGAVAQHVAVDQGFDSAYLVRLGTQTRDLRAADVTFFTAPTTGTGTSDDGQSIVDLDWAKLGELKAAFQDDRLDAYQPTSEIPD